MKVIEVHKRTAYELRHMWIFGEVQENVDWNCIINIEKRKDTGQYYLTFKRVKIRYKDPNDLGYFNHPFEISNRVQLIDDIFMSKSLSEESLATTFEGVTEITTKGRKQATKRKVDEDEGLFDFASKAN